MLTYTQNKMYIKILAFIHTCMIKHIFVYLWTRIRIPSWQIIHKADEHLEFAATFRGKASMHLHNHGISHLPQLPNRGPTFLLHFLHYLHCPGPPSLLPHFPPQHFCRRHSSRHRCHTHNSHHHLLLHCRSQRNETQKQEQEDLWKGRVFLLIYSDLYSKIW